jgi:hypothetical protein
MEETVKSYFATILEAPKIVSAIACLCFLSIALLMTVSCGKKSPSDELRQLLSKHAQTDVNAFLLDRLSENRIVMLGDRQPGDPRYSQTVIRCLDYWLEQARANTETEQLPRHLGLVIEIDTSSLEKIRSYWESNDPFDVINFASFMTPSYTTQELEFYFDLGRIYREKVDINRGRSAEDSISFEVVALDPSVNLAGRTQEELAQYYLIERDERTAAAVGTYLRRHPESHLLMFYDEQQLITELTLKSSGPYQSEGYQLAHYLASEFDDSGGFYTVIQRPAYADTSVYAPILMEPGESYAIDHLPFTELTEEIPMFGRIDGSIIHTKSLERPWPLQHVRSARVTAFVVDNLDGLSDGTSNRSQKYWPDVMAYLQIISGKPSMPFDLSDPTAVQLAISQWKDWYADADIDVVTDMAKLDLWQRLVAHLRNSQGESYVWREYVLAQSLDINPMHPRDDTSITADQRAQDYWEYIQANRQRLVIQNLVYLLWLSNEDEETKAVNLLQRLTEQELYTADEWTGWWRAHHDGFATEVRKHP